MKKLTTPFYTLGEDTKKEIFALLNACESVKLGNVSFDYYGLTETKFNMQKLANNWQLVINTGQGRDLYQIRNNEITYDYSEK